MNDDGLTNRITLASGLFNEMYAGPILAPTPPPLPPTDPGNVKDRQAILRSHEVRAPRNAGCPCGSGRKFKRCCLVRAQPRPMA